MDKIQQKIKVINDHSRSCQEILNQTNDRMTEEEEKVQNQIDNIDKKLIDCLNERGMSDFSDLEQLVEEYELRQKEELEYEETLYDLNNEFKTNQIKFRDLENQLNQIQKCLALVIREETDYLHKYRNIQHLLNVHNIGKSTDPNHKRFEIICKKVTEFKKTNAKLLGFLCENVKVKECANLKAINSILDVNLKHCLITQDRDTAMAVIQYFKSNHLGQIKCLIIQDSPHVRTDHVVGLSRAFDLVACSEEVKHIVSSLLYNWYVCETEYKAKDLSHVVVRDGRNEDTMVAIRRNVVSLDGAKFSARGDVTCYLARGYSECSNPWELSVVGGKELEYDLKWNQNVNVKKVYSGEKLAQIQQQLLDLHKRKKKHENTIALITNQLTQNRLDYELLKRNLQEHEIKRPPTALLDKEKLPENSELYTNLIARRKDMTKQLSNLIYSRLNFNPITEERLCKEEHPLAIHPVNYLQKEIFLASKHVKKYQDLLSKYESKKIDVSADISQRSQKLSDCTNQFLIPLREKKHLLTQTKSTLQEKHLKISQDLSHHESNLSSLTKQTHSIARNLNLVKSSISKLSSDLDLISVSITSYSSISPENSATQLPSLSQRTQSLITHLIHLQSNPSRPNQNIITQFENQKESHASTTTLLSSTHHSILKTKSSISFIQSQIFSHTMQTVKILNSTMSQITQMLINPSAECCFEAPADNYQTLHSNGLSLSLNPSINQISQKNRLSHAPFVPWNLLSGGQKAIAALALSIAIATRLGSRLLIFDEIDANLDIHVCTNLANLIIQYNHNQFIIISHRWPLISSIPHLIAIYTNMKSSHAIPVFFS